MDQSRNGNFGETIKNLARGIDWKCLGAVLTAFLVTRLMVVIVTYFSLAQIPVLSGDGLWRYDVKNLIIDGLIRWDSGWYIPIAQSGYVFDSTAFFPMYPLLIRLTAYITGNMWTSGLWVSNIAFFIALFYLYGIAKHEFDDDTASRTVFYVAAAPAAFFFSTVYAESIFFLFVVASFYYAIKGKWLPAALAGALASATRLSGVFTGVFILFEALWLQGVRFIPKPRSFKAFFALLKNDLKLLPGAWKGILAAAATASGLIAYMVFLYIKFKNPLAFLSAESNWGRAVTWKWPLILTHNILDMHQVTGSILSGNIGTFAYLLDTLSIVVFLPLVIIVLFKFRPSYIWFTLLSFFSPITSGSPLSMRRFVMVLIPCFLLLGSWGKHRWVDRLIVAISLPLQAYLMILFSHWFFAG